VALRPGYMRRVREAQRNDDGTIVGKIRDGDSLDTLIRMADEHRPRCEWAVSAGMAAGADSIDDMDLLRDGAMETLLSGVRAPSTPGSHLCSYKWGNVRQLDKAHRGGDC
jgi:hypothetical protein